MWIKLEVYNGDEYLDSMYTNATTKQGIINDINDEFGYGKWTRYNIGN